jgi:hypothetical protein
MVRIDEAWHDDAAARVDLRGVSRMQVPPDGKNLLALDQPTFGSIDMTEPPRMT